MSGMEGLDPKLLAEMSPMEFGKFLRDIREKRGLRQHEVAARARVHPSYISHLEAGNKDLRKARPQMAIPILRAYGLSEELIMEVIKHWSEPFKEMAKRLEVTNVLAENEVRLTPLHLPVVEAGAGSPAWDDARETLTLYLPELRGKENRVFGVRIVGDSMEPLLYEGDIAIVWTEGAYGPGTIVAIGIPGNGIAVKQLYYGPKGEAIMHSLNPRYADEPVPEGSKIWGPVIQVVRSLPNGKPGRHLLR
ncbi:hypothetical protein CSW47_08210 [Thermus scotoductus]|uniref:HTH cro/C1-type domain-containing protein n=1 Tax=Thermus scotoductus TaxID=37636 RepID=A0A430R8E7_THESC|nr:S24 family peptidase [Thermus scotoductus]RTH03669.1 hypothetical protein CSW47_08210 [Thermus scotoductus]